MKILSVSSLWLLLLAATGAMAAVLGIDFGEEYTKAALVAPGVPFEIILTSDSKRKDISGITFKKVGDEVERVYGNSAAALLTRFPEASAFYYKSLLGKSLDSAEATTFKSQQPGPVLIPSNNNRSTIAYSINGETYPVEEVLAMSLSKIKTSATQLLEANQGAGYIKDVAVTVPAYFNVEQRRAIEDAVEIAGLNLISLVNEGVAVAVNFASTRQFDENKQYHIIFDVGAGSTTATLVSFHHGEIVEENNRVPTSGTVIDVIGTSYNTDLGGHALTEFIRDILVEKFLAKNSKIKKADLVSDARAYSKLWREAEKAKIILSANTETSVSIESLYNDIDFSSKVSRIEFEKLADQLKQDVTGPILDVLGNPLAGTSPLDLSQIDSIILTGGSVRVPFIQSVLQELTEGKVSLAKNVNGDEAAVMGTTLRGVGISKIFKSKHVIHVNDRSVWNYDLSINSKKATTLFERGSQLGSSKTLTLDVDGDFTLDLYENNSKIVKYLGSGVEKTIEAVSTDAKKECIDEVQVEAEFTLTHSRTVELTRLSAKCSAKDKPASKTSADAPVDTAEATLTADSISEENATDASEDVEESTSSETVSKEATQTETAEAQISSASAVEKPAKVFRKNITIKAKYDGPRPMGAASKQGSVTKLHLLNYADNQRVAKEEERNILEGAIYRVKERVADSGDEVALAKISAFAEWLEVDGQSASLKEIKEKRAELEGFSKELESSDSVAVPDVVDPEEVSKTSAVPPEVTEDYSELGQSIKGIFAQYEELQKALYKAGLNPHEDQKKLGLDLSKLDNYAGGDLEPEQDVAQRIKESMQLLEDTIRVGKSGDEEAKAKLAAKIEERQRLLDEQQKIKERNDDKRFNAAKQMIEDAGKSQDVNDRMAGTAVVDPNKPTDTPVEHDEL